MWSSLESLTKLNDWLLFFAALAALITAVLGLGVYKVGARVALLQDRANSAYRQEADGRISGANQKAAEADERSKQLENDNLALKGKVSTLEKAASDAETAQHNVEIDLQHAIAESRSKARELADAQRQAADAQLALAQQLKAVEKARSYRVIDPSRFLQYIKESPKRTVLLRYHANDPEAYFFASQICNVLGPGIKGDGAGWDVTQPEPIAFSGGAERSPQNAYKLDYGNTNEGSGIAIVAKRAFKTGTEDDVALQSLTRAIGLSLGLPAVGITVRYDDNLSEGTFVLIIGQKQ